MLYIWSCVMYKGGDRSRGTSRRLSPICDIEVKQEDDLHVFCNYGMERVAGLGGRLHARAWLL